MASVTWPLTLPQPFLVAGYSETFPNVMERTQMDAGPARVRRTMSGNVRPYTGQQIMNDTQVGILDDFFMNTLSGGTIRFIFPTPRTGTTGEFRFTAPPKVTAAKAKENGERQWFVDMAMEKMP
jgi:hypothetical protein